MVVVASVIKSRQGAGRFLFRQRFAPPAYIYICVFSKPEIAIQGYRQHIVSGISPCRKWLCLSQPQTNFLVRVSAEDAFWIAH